MGALVTLPHRWLLLLLLGAGGGSGGVGAASAGGGLWSVCSMALVDMSRKKVAGNATSVLQDIRKLKLHIPARELVSTNCTLVGSIAGVCGWGNVESVRALELAGAGRGDSRERMWRATCWGRVNVDWHTGHLWSPAIS